MINKFLKYKIFSSFFIFDILKNQSEISDIQEVKRSLCMYTFFFSIQLFQMTAGVDTLF